jgi:hypothetical protein
MRSLHKLLLAAIACPLTTLAFAHDKDTTSPFDPNVQDLTLPHQGPPMLGIHWSREDHASHQGRPTKNPNMTYHGGKIVPTAVTQAIFWGPSWTNASFAGDKITGLDTWYGGHGDSNYAKTSDEYTGTNGRVGAATSHLGSLVDPSTAAGGNNTSIILAEVCKVVTAPEPNGNGYYAVYSDVKRGGAQYCAYHSAGTCHGVAVQFAFFFNLDGDAGCDPQDTSRQHSQGLAALANVTAHELAEARTDPASPGAWYDNSGAENGDKCAWTFGAPLVNFSNGTRWKLQGEWSNAAYNAGTGYPNSSGQRGCLSGL